MSAAQPCVCSVKHKGKAMFSANKIGVRATREDGLIPERGQVLCEPECMSACQVHTEL